MMRLMMATKGCGQLMSNDTYFFDIWFGRVKTAEQAIAEGVDYCGLLKTSHRGFFLAKFEMLMKKWPGGSYLVVKSTPSVPGDRPNISIGYKYNSRKVQGFIATEWAGITEPGDPYLSRYPENYYNVSVLPVVLSHLLGRYYNAYNAIDNHNSMWQSDLALEKYWMTQSGYF